MWLLIKNTLRSFLKTKTSIILIAILVFLTTSIFTLMSSVSGSFEKSYNQVVVANKLHDFTSKEKYNLQGELKFKEGSFNKNGEFVPVTMKDGTYNVQDSIKEGSIVKKDILVPDTSSDAFSKDLQYIYVKNIENYMTIQEEDKWLFSTSWKDVKNFVGRIKTSDLSWIDSNDDGAVDSINVPEGNSLRIEVLPKESKTMEEMQTNASKAKKTEWISDPKIAISAFNTIGKELFKNDKYRFQAKKDINTFLKELKDYFNEEKRYIDNFYSEDGTYLYIPKFENLFDFGGAKNILGRIKTENLTLKKPSIPSKDFIGTIEVTDGSPFQILSRKQYDTGPFWWDKTIKIDPKEKSTWDKKGIKDLGKDYDWKEIKKKAENKDNQWLASGFMKLSNQKKNKNLFPTNDKPKDFNIKSKLNNVQFADYIKKIFNKKYSKKKLLKQVTGNTLSMVVDEEKSTGIFKELLGSKESITDKLSTRDKINQFIKNNQLYKPIIIDNDDQIKKLAIDQRKKLAIGQERLRNFIKSFAFNEKRSNYINLIDDKYGDILNHQVTESVNISNKESNFKVVSSSSHKDFNQLHIYDGFKLPKIYDQDKLEKILKEKTIARYKKAVIEIDGKKPDFNKIFDQNSQDIYTVQKAPGTFDTIWSGITGDDKQAKKLNIVYTHASIDDTKEYKITSHWSKQTEGSGIQKMAAGLQGESTDHSSPQAESVSDPTSNFAVVSPGWIKNHKEIKFFNPASIMQEDPNDKKSDLYQLINNPEMIFAKYPDSVIDVDQVKYLVVGSGIQPDFSFPIISHKHPVPNQEKEAIIFTNHHGYLKANDAYRNNDHETYISFKVKEDKNISSKELDKILYEGRTYLDKNNKEVKNPSIEAISRKSMTWPSNIKIVSKAFDKNEQVILAPQRIVFLKSTLDTIRLISWLTSSLLSFAVALFVMIVIKKRINSRKKNLGILLANGYTKNQIGIANIVFAFVVIILPTILGYITGHMIQFTLFNIFGNYWTLPINDYTFSWISLSLYALLPFIGVSLLVYLVTRWELRGLLVDIMKNAGSKFGQSLSAKIVAPLKWMGIKTRISLSIFTTNISKMLMILVVSTISVIVISIGITMVGKFEQAAKASSDFINYKYSLNLITPTDEGGLLRKQSPENFAGANWLTDSTDDIYTRLFNYKDHQKAHEEKPVMMFPQESDEKNSENLKYLDNRIQFESLLNASIGGSNGSNPWKDTAEALIPEGQRITAKSSRIKFLKYGLNLKINKDYSEQKWYQEIKKDGVPSPESVIDPKDSTKEVKLDPNYVKFMINTLKDIFSNLDQKNQYLPLFITYRNILTNKSDEFYSYIKANLDLKNIAQKDVREQINILGIQKDSKAINLKSSSYQKLEDYKQKDQEIPIIINSYFATNYQKAVGDSISISMLNTADRYLRASDKNLDNDEKRLSLKIVDVIKTYNGSKLFTTQDYANKALGLDKLNKQKSQEEKPFNGIFTTKEAPLSLKSVPLYSPSGYYPSTDTLIKGSGAGLTLETAIKKGEYKSNPNIKTFGDYERTYSRSPYVMSWSQVDWSKMSQYTFESIMNLSNSVIYIIELLALVISTIFIIIITNMIISDNRKFIATMMTMGYRSSEISRIFFRAIFPSIILASIIAIPFTFSLLLGIQISIIAFGNVLIPLSMAGWEIISAIGFIILMTIIIYIMSTSDLRKGKAIAAFSV